MSKAKKKTEKKTPAVPKPLGRFLNDELVPGYGSPIERGNQIVMIPNENGDKVPMQRGMYKGIDRNRETARFRIEFPSAVLQAAVAKDMEFGDLFADDADEGVREVKRYVGELFGIGCAPKAVQV